MMTGAQAIAAILKIERVRQVFWFIREVRAPLVLKAIQRVGIGFREGRKAAG